MTGSITRSSSPFDLLGYCALAYLALPTLIFLTTWLRPPYAALGFVLATIAWLSVRRTAPRVNPQPQRLRVQLWIVAATLLWSAFGGGSHFVWANHDWVVRDAIVGDLAQTGWPPAYDLRDGSYYLLRSAIGFFLPVAGLGKLLGTSALEPLMYIWTAAGVAVFLLLLPLPTNSPVRLVLALLVIVFFSGMDFFGTLLLTGDTPIFPLRIEWWSRFSYSSLTSQLLWAPNHALPLWISTALLLRHWWNEELPAYLCLLLPCLPLLTPFALPGLAPFLLLLVVQRARRGAPIRVPMIALAIALIVGGLIMCLQTLDIDAIPASLTADSVHSDGFITEYAVFSLTEFGILGFALWPLTRSPERQILAVALIVLAALPFASFGPSNDLLLRVSVPSLIVLAVLAMQVVTLDRAFPVARHWVVAAILVAGVPTVFNELWRAGTWKSWHADYSRSFLDTQKGILPPHYVARLDQPLLRELLREPEIVRRQDARH